MEESDVIDTITKVCRALAPGFVFGCYDRCDIEQEAWMIAWKALDKFDPNKGKLYSFLYTHVKMRLITLKRDKFYRKSPKNYENDVKRRTIWEKRNEDKKNISQPVNMENANYIPNMSNCIAEIVAQTELFELIDQNIPIELRADFRRLVEGANVPKQRQKKLIESMKEIVKEGDDD